MTVLDRLLLAATFTGLAAVVWRVEQLRGEVTDKRIDSAALALHAWGRTTPHIHNAGDGTWTDLAVADAVRRAFSGEQA